MGDHSAEVARGERFEFGKNWSRFLKTLTVARIKLAEESLRSSLKMDRLDNLTFIDIGSGSGLFSLVARRLGAKVRSFDYDPFSFACTTEMRQRYFPGDLNWRVDRGSVLDKAFMSSLGTYDIVYSWGVLHHTGSMYEALENVKPLVPIGGRLFIAIYNDQGTPTDDWERVKKTYNSLPRPLALLYALKIIWREESPAIRTRLREGKFGDWVKTWSEYDKLSTRGMSKWHDWIDWIGGYPYERATVEQIVDYYACDGFDLEFLIDRSAGYGCNEFVFKRVAAAGVEVDVRLPGGNSMARRFGQRLKGPFSRTEQGVFATVREAPALIGDSSLFLVRNDRILGPAVVADGRVRIADADASDESLSRDKFSLLAAEERVLTPPFNKARGKMYSLGVADLGTSGDTMDAPTQSGAFLFEDDVQLPMPHTIHDLIADLGGGRFSHWGDTLYFSSLANDDPNREGRTYKLLTPGRPLPADRCFAKLHGRRLDGPARLDAGGWTVEAPNDLPRDGRILVFCGAELIATTGVYDGRLKVAPPETPEAVVAERELYAVAAERHALARPFEHSRGATWYAKVPELRELADDATDHRSPVFVLENDWQLTRPHAIHDELADLGRGRFSHWGNEILFSSSDGTEPNDNGRDYSLVVPSRKGPGA